MTEIRDNWDELDAMVERMVMKGVIVRPQHKPVFSEMYETHREQIREQILALLRTETGVEARDPRADAVYDYLSTWNTEYEKLHGFREYQIAMLNQGFEPISEEDTFRHSTKYQHTYRKRSRWSRQKYDHVVKRNCIAERWSFVKKHNIEIGGTVQDKDKFGKDVVLFTVEAITPDCFVELSNGAKRYPHVLKGVKLPNYEGMNAKESAE